MSHRLVDSPIHKTDVSSSDSKLTALSKKAVRGGPEIRCLLSGYYLLAALTQPSLSCKRSPPLMREHLELMCKPSLARPARILYLS